ncbi:MAG: RidA family protein [Rhodobacteraceae bacterium]|nr:RidA family protein [Paracoccaceae bacterium]
MAVIEARIASRGMVLPAPIRLPEGMVLPFPEVNLRGTRAFVSGASALAPDGSVMGPFGKVGDTVSVEEAAHLAEATGLAILAGLHRALGDLDRISGWARVFGMVNAVPGFDRHPQVMNGFSHLILDLFGREVGRHARSAVGMGSLPMNIAVEIEAEVLVLPL